MAMTAAELQGCDRSVAGRHLRVVRRAPRPPRPMGSGSAGRLRSAAGPSPVLRSLLGAGVTAVVLSVGGWLGAVSAPAPAPEAGAAAGVQRTLTVAPEQSVWDVAQEQAPAAVTAYAAQVLELNGLDGAYVPSGTVLQLPAS